MPLSLGVNIDHVATLRQARYQKNPTSRNCEPDPIEAALAAERGGASGITCHLRHDRRHIQEEDLWRLKNAITTKINLELGNTPEIIALALKLQPADVCLVPETREEITTEGGLDCVTHYDALKPTIEAFQQQGIRVSLFIDPEIAQIEAAASLGAPVIELHTGAYAEALDETRNKELVRLEEAAKRAASLNIQVHAGHGLNYENVISIIHLPHCRELNIGHAIISRALFVGMEQATREMVSLLADRR
ncbi:MAG: pyridoxine 5'-phosphate synthase [Verrucomicrobia bacterium RIFCSPHIGHO2_12_FULL_41_10]|nr:MAG: pyridoxine 5'-phosphate synthase [Verrucomicrobia bacterium RIFCSPHIGHO2_12_FULL_41_10]HLB33519.1 pyridoxine 5'-phosphate synthase [Chthoniobacterales bacterium]